MIKDSINHSKTPLQGEAETDPTPEVLDFLAKSKEEMINEFIIPNYPLKRVFNIGDVDLFYPTLEAFHKALRITFGEGRKIVDISAKISDFWLNAVEDRFEELDDSDFVSIFEYILEGQDRVLEAKKEEQRLLDLVKKMCLPPEDLLDLVERIKEHTNSVGILPYRIKEGSSLLKYDYEIGDFYGYLKPSAFLLDLRSILEGLGLNWNNLVIADFLQAFGLQFDGDAEACFYETWKYLEDIFDEDEDWATIEDFQGCRAFLVDSVYKFSQGFTLKDHVGKEIEISLSYSLVDICEATTEWHRNFAKQNVFFNQ